MKLQEVAVQRMPGVAGPLVLAGFADGVNLVIGPNASGKSSLCRALLASLWPEPATGTRASPWLRAVELTSRWHWRDEAWLAEMREGRVLWRRDDQSSASPPLPDRRQAGAYLFAMRDLLADDAPGDRALLERIQIEMAGGFDLAKLRERAPGPQIGRSERTALQRAERELRCLVGDRRQLAGAQDRLSTLREQGRRARAAEVEGVVLKDALARARKAAALRERQVELKSLPAPAEEMALLTGRERQQLDQLQEDIEAVRGRRQEARRALESARVEAASCALPDGAPDEADLAYWQAREREIEQRGEQRGRRLHELEQARAARRAAESLLGPDRGEAGEAAAADIFADDLRGVEAWVWRAFALRERRARLEATLDSDAETRRSEGARPAGIRGAYAQSVATALAGALLALVAAIAMPSARPLWRLGLAGIGLALFGWASRGIYALGRRSAESQRGLGARAERSAQLAALEREEKGVDKERVALEARLGLDPARGDLALADLLERLRRWREASLRERECVESLAELDADLSKRRRALSAWVDALQSGRAGDPEGAEARFEDLLGRCRRWREAESEHARAECELKAQSEELAKREGRRVAMLREARLLREGEEPSAARRRLEERLAALDRFGALREEIRALEAQIGELEERLAHRGELLDLGAAALEERIEAATRSARVLTEVAAEIGAIEARIEDAGASGELEARRAEVARAREALAARREEWMLARAASRLLERVEREYAQTSRPLVLRRAIQYFAAFTRDRYRLEFEQRGGGACYTAIETESGRRLALAELSDGTRMQLLLASRLAFATGAERDLQPPLFLDEALSASDPDRFGAIAGALLELAKRGRQIFYLSCNPADAACWREIAREHAAPGICVIELAHERARQWALADPARLVAPQRPPVPVPDGHTPESYGLALDLPEPDPFAGVSDLHLFHLLRDDLSLLYSLLSRARVERVGHWLSFCERGAGERGAGAALFGEAVCRRLQARIALADAFLRAWRIGRGRPVDRAALRESGEVSERFIDGLAELAEEKGGDARALLAAIDARDSRALRFQRSKRDALEGYFESERYLDRRVVLEEHDRRARVLSEIGSQLGDDAAALELEQALHLIDSLAALFDSGASSPPSVAGDD